MRKKILSTLLALTLSSSMLCSTASAITMYAPDGRTKEVPSSEIEYRKSVGWYESKTITMYSLDGRTKEVPISEIEYRKSVGWYKVPVTKVYAPDGRSQVIAKSDVDAWVKVGWYKSKSITMYSSDGRTKDVPLSEIDYRKSLGWSETPVAVKKNTNTNTSSSIDYYYDFEKPFPKYDSIIKNSRFIKKDKTTGIYVYEYTDSTDFSNYTSYLASIGWSYYDTETDYVDYTFTTYMSKGSSLISIVAALKYDEVWIIYK